MARRKSKRAESQLAFDALSIEGGLLSPEWLSKVAQLAAGQQSESDYRIPKGLNLRDEIGRYWRIAQAHWADFALAGTGANAQAAATRFVVAILRESFGFGSLTSIATVTLDGRSYPIGHSALGARVPVVIAPAGSGLDTLAPEFGDENRRRSGFGLVQEYLNADEGALWGLVSDGVTLRIARDNASLTRPAWVEADVARIFAEQRFADFAALWLLAHETRFGEADQPVAECALERWREAGREQGTVARERLRFGVEDALLALGQGFLAHPGNQKLRGDLQNGSLSTKDYFNQLLRLVYRLIFLLTVEERGLLHPDGTDGKSAALYADGYSIRRLRERAVRRSAHDRFSDLWESTKIVFGGLAMGEARLGLPALAGIFATAQCPALDGSRLENRHLSLAMFKLSWIRDDASLSRVNWRDMGPEELGSVYESLLELVPQITKDGRQFTFASGGETKGNARKTSGSYYTPDSLVQVLLDSALEPVVAETIAKNPDKPAEALLKLSVVDPACGSGHFLLAAARRLAAHVARLEANGTPSAREYRHALRQVIGHCIYGVDLNPMAVELCKVSLWMEAVEPGLPLTFLNSHIQHGNALLGTTPELMAKGIPDAAWDPIEGDDKKVASALKKRNKAVASGQRNLGLFGADPTAEQQAVARAVSELEAAADADIAQLANKELRWEDILASPAYRHQRLTADTWCAAFVWPKQAGPLVNAAPTTDVWRQLRDGQGEPPKLTVETVAELAHRYRFFHWHLQFPHVFERGGFDVVLGNPPWEKIKLLEQEFFASRSDLIARAPKAAARKALIAELPDTDPALWAEWCSAGRVAEGQSHFIRNSLRYPFCGRGDVNTYALFAEHNSAVVSSSGRAGFIVPSGIATDDTTKDYFGAMTSSARLRSLYDFQTGPGLFGDIGHARFKFCLLTIGRGSVDAELAFFARDVADLSRSGRRFALSAGDFELLNPNTRTCPTFRSRRDADINLAIYRRTGVLWADGDDGQNPWALRFMTMFHMTNDSGLFRTRPQLESAGALRAGNCFELDGERFLPLVEAKMVHHFDHRFGDYSDRAADSENTSLPDVPVERLNNPSYSPMARYWVAAAEVSARLADKWTRAWVLGWRDICRSFDERTVIPALIPRSGVGNTMPLIVLGTEPRLTAALYASLCSFALDYTARQKVGGTHLNFVQMKQLPVLAPACYARDAAWSPGDTVGDWLLPRILELAYTSWDLEPFARDVGYEGPPFPWDVERRFILRCEIDAAFFHLYGLPKQDVAYVMDSFPIVRKNDEKAHNGEYRTKDVILDIYDAMAQATESRSPYRTRLQRLPGAPGASHGAFAPEGTPSDYAEALRIGLIFALALRSGDAGISTGALSRAVLWLHEPKYASSWLDASSLGIFERVRGSDRLLADGTAEGGVPKLLAALENERAITRDAKGTVRVRGGASIPKWLPQTPSLATLADAMLGGLDRAERGAPATHATDTSAGKAKEA